jgi:hypothetical protein
VHNEKENERPKYFQVLSKGFIFQPINNLQVITKQNDGPGSSIRIKETIQRDNAFESELKKWECVKKWVI